MKNANRNSLLTEITIVILFFALASVMLLKLFTGVFELSSHAARQTDAVIFVQDLGEKLKAASDMEKTLAANGFRKADGEWTLESEDFSVICDLTITQGASGTLLTANLLAKTDETVLSEYSASRYFPKEAVSE